MTNTSSPRGKVYRSIIETIGGTPLVCLNKIPQKAGCTATILVKCEFFNPLSSVKDRTALGMIEEAEQSGMLHAGSVIVEATSGNTGIGLAFIASLKGYKLVLTMPDNMSAERRKLLTFLGATLVLTPAADSMAGALRKADEIVATQEGAITLRQFTNPANPAIHCRTTAEEIWVDTKGRVDAFVAGVGTGGTIQGVGAELKSRNRSIKILAVEPESSAVLSGHAPSTHGIQGIGAGFVPDILDTSIIDEIIRVTDKEAIAHTRLLARSEGIFAGISSGAAVCAAIKIAQRTDMNGKTIVVLLPDSAERYLSTALF